MAKISAIPAMPKRPSRKKVAAYARVSTGKDAMLHSLASQVSAYSTLIQSNPGWEYAGVYSDEALTGTKAERPGFKALLDAARRGEVDMVLTKSISRFARNTVDLLAAVRELKSLGIDVYFEEQRIHSLSGDGELMLSILASYAQEESRSASENVKWHVRNEFSEGKATYWRMIGYRWVDGTFVVVPEEAETVRRIFSLYLSGKGVVAIAKALNSDGSLTIHGNAWTGQSVQRVLANADYTGDIVLQKTYRRDHITKRKTMNRGEYPKYVVEGAFDPIVDKDTFRKAQEEMARRGERYRHGDTTRRYPYSGRIVCGHCGEKLRRKTVKGKRYWSCPTYNFLGRESCPSKQIPEPSLTAAVPSMDGIKEIKALDGNRLILTFEDGRTEERTWKDPSRRDSWTPEMREKARQRAIAQRRREKDA